LTPLFVVGAPRSGTTLTRALLRGFEEVYLPPDEFQILPRFAAVTEGGASAAEITELVAGSVFAQHMRRRGIWPSEHDLERAIAGLGASEAFRAIVLAIAKKENTGPVRYWGDKTPETVFELDLVMRLWPDAQVIEVVRDPRATVLSMRQAWNRSLLRGAVIWRDAQNATKRFAETYGNDRLHRLKYEDLVEEPAAEMDRLGAWLGLTYDHDALSQISSEERWGGASGAKGVQKRGTNWREHLSSGDLRLIEEICFDVMQEAGFKPSEAQQVRQPGKAALQLARAGDAFRVLRAYARERGWANALRYKLNQWRNS
jgi:hypothetical protein